MCGTIAKIKSKTLLILIGMTLLGFALSENALAAEEAAHMHNHDDHGSFSFFSLVKPLGICALSSLLITLLTGLFRRKLGRHFLKVHRISAFLTVIIALFHGILVLMLF